MYTVESLRKQFEEGHNKCLADPRFKSETKPLFNDDGTFNRKNWNSFQDDVRGRLYSRNLKDSIYIGSEVHVCNYKNKEDIDITNGYIDLHGYIRCNDGQWYIFINIINDDEERYDGYVVTWYKSRGCTEMITKNGKPINIDEYVSLLNELETIGYFEPENWKL